VWKSAHPNNHGPDAISMVMRRRPSAGGKAKVLRILSQCHAAHPQLASAHRAHVWRGEVATGYGVDFL